MAEVVAVARSIRRRLEDGTPSLSELARRSGVDRSTIYDLLAGRAWIDVSTLARLEAALGTRLWPSSQS
ncbi:MAG: helix-turn-helix transcriptional regulator [Acidimicrobiia bacterium]|nr:helix-turn-helix transcriptional regulator [Acidimicrobiia bacterium]